MEGIDRAQQPGFEEAHDVPLELPPLQRVLEVDLSAAPVQLNDRGRSVGMEQPGRKQKAPVRRFDEVVAVAASALFPRRPRPAQMTLERRQPAQLVERRPVAPDERLIEGLDGKAAGRETLAGLDARPAARRRHEHVHATASLHQAGQCAVVERRDSPEVPGAELRENEEESHSPSRQRQSKKTRLQSARDARPEPYTSAPSTLSSKASGT